MKKYIFIELCIISSLMLLTSATFSEKEKFYYAFGEKISLVVKENTILVKYTENVSETKAIESIESISKTTKMKWRNSSIVEISTDSYETNKELMAKLRQKSEVQSCMPLYTLKNGMEMGVTDEILIRFLPNITEEQRQGLESKFNLEVIKETKLYQKLKVPKGSDALNIANQCYESGLVEFATPNFVSYPKFHQVFPNDTYFNMQITCHNTGQTINDGHSGSNDADIDAPEAWALTTGSNNIVIAVIDEGVTSDHPDLPNSRQVRLNGSNFGEGNVNDPSPTGNDNHGNACAGVIAATMNNNEGIAGIAPNCRIMPIRIHNTLPDGVADAIEFAVDNGARILSNSWGYGSDNQNLHPVIVSAIDYAINNNRVVVFAAGNTANHADDNNGYVTFPANVNISGVITVGASDRNDNQSNYSPSSNLIDIVAPSHRAYPDQIEGETFEMWSIDIPGNAGYNTWKPEFIHPPAVGEVLPDAGSNNLAYTGRFGGTSHSCPVVAGVAALLLSINSNLSNMDVFNLLTSTADKVGGYTYANGRCNEMGFGRVNAFRAVSSQISITGPDIVCSSGAQFTINNIPENPNVTWDYDHSLLEPMDGNDTGYPKSFKSIGADDGFGPKGTGWISATVNGVPLQPIILHVGAPSNPVMQGPSTVSPGVYYRYSFSLNDVAEVTDIEWVASPNATISGSSYSVSIRFGQRGYGAVSVGVTNQCGQSFGFKMVSVGYPNPFLLYPNPASNILNIEIDPEALTLAQASLPAATDGKQLKQDPTFDIRLYDNQGTLLRHKKAKGGTVQFNVANLPNGIYYLHIYDGVNEKPEIRQIMVEH